MVDRSFFNESMEQSTVKAAITQKYFWAWAKVIIPTAKKHRNKIGYIDLFAGPGRYEDGAKSTPMLILEKAVTDSDISQMLVSIFNDVDANNTHSLEEAIASIQNIQSLQHKPQILNLEVNEELVKQLESVHFIPSLFFIDPWGYKALSLKLFGSIIKDWGCDCIFFFNYNRINMGITNDFVTERMDSLFGKPRASKLRAQLGSMTPEDRELAIVEAICDSLREVGGKYPLPFRFRKRDRDSTSHHLIFVSKNVKGYTIMKEIMANESSTMVQGVPSFEYNPASALHPLLFSLNQSLDILADMLLDEFAGRTLTMQQVFEYHNINRPYIEKNYKEALKNLESQGKISVEPPATNRRKNTMAGSVRVSFPAKQ
jgi:three-Cys-motif partner protein